MLDKYKSLLKNTSVIIDHQRELDAIRGETFNVFSILKLEAKENRTHSAFIAELLDPKGSHKMGNVFLKLFLSHIGFEPETTYENPQITKEFYIGPIDNENKTGGRIDILIQLDNGQIISIENKIYALDQDHQIERYVNYNTSKNTVYYLTLTGEEPTKGSSGTLIAETDYYCLSYSSDMINWLEGCQKEAVTKPIIRETIRQYILLLKKLTHQLSDTKMQEEIIKEISKEYEAARQIADTIETAEKQAAQSLMTEIEKALNQQKKRKFWTAEVEKIEEKVGGINFFHENHEDIFIALEWEGFAHKSFSYIGIFAKSKTAYETGKKIAQNDYFSQYDSEALDEDFEGWPCYFVIDDMDFYKADKKSNLFNDQKRKDIIDDVTNKILEIAEKFDQHILASK